MRSFVHRFGLADYVTVASASFRDGLLTIELMRELPEEMKPRRIEIQARDALPKGKYQEIEQKKKQAA